MYLKARLYTFIKHGFMPSHIAHGTPLLYPQASADVCAISYMLSVSGNLSAIQQAT
jgi:hypothetical protein